MASVDGASIASAAEAFQGIPYKWGGYLPSTGWDCSGCVNYVLGNALGMTLPGGFTWSGSGHGPVAAQYLTWSGAYMVSKPQAGDLCCWETHIGIAVSGSKMLSALDPQYGTAITPIQGFGPAGEVLAYRRVTAGGAQSATLTSAVTTSASGCRSSLLLMPFLIPAALVRRAWQR
jgi:cell wall-associated NlpC family hydrolase